MVSQSAQYFLPIVSAKFQVALIRIDDPQAKDVPDCETTRRACSKAAASDTLPPTGDGVVSDGSGRVSWAVSIVICRRSLAIGAATRKALG